MIIYPAIGFERRAVCQARTRRCPKEDGLESDPVKVALRFVDEGAEALHIIDLDGAVENVRKNNDVIRRITEQVAIPISVGGGIRTFEDAEALIGLGVDKIIIGTVALENRALLLRMIKAFSDQLVVSLDAKNGEVLTRGWLHSSKIRILEAAMDLESLGVRTIVVTDISKDGMLRGPNIGLYRELHGKTGLNIIASGGIASLEDIRALGRLSLYGAITGKALYERRFTLKEAITCLQSE